MLADFATIVEVFFAEQFEDFQSNPRQSMTIYQQIHFLFWLTETLQKEGSSLRFSACTRTVYGKLAGKAMMTRIAGGGWGNVTTYVCIEGVHCYMQQYHLNFKYWHEFYCLEEKLAYDLMIIHLSRS